MDKATAKREIEDMEQRIERAELAIERSRGGPGRAAEMKRVAEFRAEAERIRALLPTLQD